ncbi:hypothetical protein DNTS_025574 [Danionella cerebrum]|uniref:Uncharacterized protein n=1 Tax=Danionella cerebrum TaxID=2873325 RepID=A0A553PYR1_9TELE|nr:hypothetical protein DNTS_025574 [Danionella translucida]
MSVFLGPSATNLIIGSIAGAILMAAIVLGGTGWGFKLARAIAECYQSIAQRLGSPQGESLSGEGWRLCRRQPLCHGWLLRPLISRKALGPPEILEQSKSPHPPPGFARHRCLYCLLHRDLSRSFPLWSIPSIHSEPLSTQRMALDGDTHQGKTSGLHHFTSGSDPSMTSFSGGPCMAAERHHGKTTHLSISC